MKTLIIGAGAVGIGVGASLIQGGMEVEFFARGNTKNSIDKYGIKRTGVFGDYSVPAGTIKTYDSYSDLPVYEYDFVLVATKNYANEEVAAGFNEYRDCMTDECKIVFLQNGLGYQVPFLQYFEESQLYHCRLITGFEKEADNISCVTAHQAPILFGSLFGYDCEEARPLMEALVNAGVSSELKQDIEKDMWAKFIYNTTLNPIGAILNMTYGELADSEYAHSIMDILIEETFEIMNAVDGKTYWDNADDYREVLYNQMIPDTYNHRSSTLQDITRKQKTEIDLLTGSLLELSAECNVPAPVHSMIYWLVKALEEKF